MSNNKESQRANVHPVWGLDKVLWKEFRREVFLQDKTCGKMLNQLIREWLDKQQK